MDLFERFHQMVAAGNGTEPTPQDMGKLAAFAGVRDYPARGEVRYVGMAHVAGGPGRPGKGRQHRVAAERRIVETVADQKEIEERTIEALQTCYDPEVPVNIHEMGLIYGVDVDPLGQVTVTMTLTAPNCPRRPNRFPMEVEEKVRAVEGVKDVHVEIVWEPPWDPSRMSDAAKLQLGML